MGIGKGSKVSWKTSIGFTGMGEVFTDPDEYEHVLVSVNAPQGEEHRVIRCALTWLTLL